MDKIEFIIARHMELEFPASAGSEDLSPLDEWIGDLAEYDGGIVGRIHSKTLSPQHLVELKNFGAALEEILPKSDEIETIAYCKRYVASLIECATEALASFSRKIR